jgi:hypothetical protein
MKLAFLLKDDLWGMVETISFFQDKKIKVVATKV